MKYFIQALLAFLIFGSAHSSIEVFKYHDSIHSRILIIQLDSLGSTIGFDIEIKKNTDDENKANKQRYFLADSQFRVKLLPGDYQFRARRYIQQNYYGEWNEWKDIHIPKRDDSTGKKLPPEDLINITISPKLDFYNDDLLPKYEIYHYKSNKYSLISTEDDVIQTALVPGKYRIRAKYISKSKSDVIAPSEWSKPKDFFVPMALSKPIHPKENFIIRDINKDSPYTYFEWQKNPYATKYEFQLYTEELIAIRKSQLRANKLKVILENGKKYFWYVRPLSEEEIKADIVDPKKMNSFSVSEIAYIGLNEAEEPSDIYLTLNYHLSRLSYESFYFDENKNILNKFWGHSIELQFGRWFESPKIGVKAFFNLSALALEEENLLYNSYGFQGGYRYKFNPDSRLRVWLGVARKSLPQILGTAVGQPVDLIDIKTTGFYGSSSFLHRINALYGAYTSLTYFTSISDGTTPNSQAIEKMTNIKFSLFGTRRMSKKVRAKVGYSFIRDYARYPSLRTSGTFTNQVDIRGHYISISFDMDFKGLE